MRFRPANIRLINRRQNPPRLLLALSLKNNKSEDNDKNSPIDVQKLTRHSISVLSRWLGVVDGQRLDRALCGRELEADFTHGIEDRVRDLAARRVAWPAFEVKGAGQSGLIDYGPLENAADAGGEFGHGDILSSHARGGAD